MSEFDIREKRFEDDIESFFCTTGGYAKRNPKVFNRELALDIETLLSFIKQSQPKKWERYTKLYGDSCEQQFLKRFNDSVEHD